MASRFSGTSGSFDGGGAAAAGDGTAAAVEAGPLAGTSAFATVFAVLAAVFSGFEPDAGTAVLTLTFAGIAPARGFAPDATAGSAFGCASPAGFDGCGGTSFFGAGSTSDVAGGAAGIIEAILSFSTSTYP